MKFCTVCSLYRDAINVPLNQPLVHFLVCQAPHCDVYMSSKALNRSITKWVPNKSRVFQKVPGLPNCYEGPEALRFAAYGQFVLVLVIMHNFCRNMQLLRDRVKLKFFFLFMVFSLKGFAVQLAYS